MQPPSISLHYDAVCGAHADGPQDLRPFLLRHTYLIWYVGGLLYYDSKVIYCWSLERIGPYTSLLGASDGIANQHGR